MLTPVCTSISPDQLFASKSGAIAGIARVIVSIGVSLIARFASKDEAWAVSFVVALGALVRFGASRLPVIKRTCSAGEVAIVSQGVSIMVLASIRNAAAVHGSTRNVPEEFVYVVAACGLSFTFALSAAALAVDQAYGARKGRNKILRPVAVWATILCGVVVALIALLQITGMSPALWLKTFLLDSSNSTGDRSFCRFAILAAWGIVVPGFIGSISDSSSCVNGGWGLRRTVARKLFHALAVIIFTPVALVDPNLLTLAYAVASALLIVVEVVRTANGSKSLELFGIPVGLVLRKYYEKFVDYREASGVDDLTLDATSPLSNDEGCCIQQRRLRKRTSLSDLKQRRIVEAAPQVVLTPLYLLLGCAVPHWIAQSLGHHGSNIFLVGLSGVTALGVGDAAAAVIGSTWGKTFWPG